MKGALRNVASTDPYEFHRYATDQGFNPQGKVDYLKDTFLYSDYTYFTIQPDDEQIRIVRFCQCDPGFGGNFLSRYQIRLQCRTEERDITSSSATFSQTSLGPSMFVTVNYRTSTGIIRSEVCTFSVEEINRLMLNKLTDCASGIGNVGFGSQTAPCPSHFTVEQKDILIGVSI